MADTRREIRRSLADFLRRTQPDLCLALDALLAAGEPPEAIQAHVDRAADQVNAQVAHHLVWCYLAEARPDYAARAEREVRLRPSRALN